MRITAGELKGRHIKTLKGFCYRPATSKIRESIFSIIKTYNIKWNETKVLDFFAGSGSLGIEALSRGASEVWFVDKDKRAINTIKYNLENFQISRSRYKLFCCDVFSFLNKKKLERFQIIFIDPPYRKGLLDKFLKKLVNSDFIDKNCLIFAEVEKELELFYDRLTLISNKIYGQTRLYLWTVTAQK